MRVSEDMQACKAVVDTADAKILQANMREFSAAAAVTWSLLHIQHRPGTRLPDVVALV